MSSDDKHVHGSFWRNIHLGIRTPPPASKMASNFRCVPWQGNGTTVIRVGGNGSASSDPKVCRLWVEPWNKEFPLHSAICDKSQTTALMPQTDSEGRQNPEMGLDVNPVLQGLRPTITWNPDLAVHAEYPYTTPTFIDSGFKDHGISGTHWTWGMGGDGYPAPYLPDFMDMRAFFLGGYIEVKAHVQNGTTLKVFNIGPLEYRKCGNSEIRNLGGYDHYTTQPLERYPYSDAHLMATEAVLNDPVATDHEIDPTLFGPGGAENMGYTPSIAVGEQHANITHYSAIPIVPVRHGLMNLISKQTTQWGTPQNCHVPSLFQMIPSSMAYQWKGGGEVYGKHGRNEIMTYENDNIASYTPCSCGAVFATMTVGQVIPDDSILHVIVWNNKLASGNLSAFYDEVTGRFVAPYDSVYTFSGSITLPGIPGGTIIGYLNYNGTRIVTESISVSGTAGTASDVSSQSAQTVLDGNNDALVFGTVVASDLGMYNAVTGVVTVGNTGVYALDATVNVPSHMSGYLTLTLESLGSGILSSTRSHARFHTSHELEGCEYTIGTLPSVILDGNTTTIIHDLQVGTSTLSGYNTTTGEYTVPRDGTYAISMSLGGITSTDIASSVEISMLRDSSLIETRTLIPKRYEGADFLTYAFGTSDTQAIADATPTIVKWLSQKEYTFAVGAGPGGPYNPSSGLFTPQQGGLYMLEAAFVIPKTYTGQLLTRIMSNSGGFITEVARERWSYGARLIASASAGQSVADEVWTTVQLDTVNATLNGFNTGTYTWTAPESGAYICTAYVIFEAISSGSSRGARFFVNGVDIYWISYSSPHKNEPTTVVATGLIILNKDDTLVVQSFTQTNRNMLPGSSLCVVKMGDASWPGTDQWNDRTFTIQKTFRGYLATTYYVELTTYGGGFTIPSAVVNGSTLYEPGRVTWTTLERDVPVFTSDLSMSKTLKLTSGQVIKFQGTASGADFTMPVSLSSHLSIVEHEYAPSTSNFIQVAKVCKLSSGDEIRVKLEPIGTDVTLAPDGTALYSIAAVVSGTSGAAGSGMSWNKSVYMTAGEYLEAELVSSGVGAPTTLVTTGNSLSITTVPRTEQPLHRCMARQRVHRATCSAPQSLMHGLPYMEYLVLGESATLEIDFKMFFQIPVTNDHSSYEHGVHHMPPTDDIGCVSHYSASACGVSLISREDAVRNMLNGTRRRIPRGVHLPVLDPRHAIEAGRMIKANAGISAPMFLGDPRLLWKLLDIGVDAHKKRTVRGDSIESVGDDKPERMKQDEVSEHGMEHDID